VTSEIKGLGLLVQSSDPHFEYIMNRVTIMRRSIIMLKHQNSFLLQLQEGIFLEHIKACGMINIGLSEKK
jgi:hypothetical protein